jgi:arginase
MEAWMRPLIVEVPSPLGLRPSGVERAPAALRAAGLHARLGCDDAQHVTVPAYDDQRDPATGVLNPGGIAEVAFSLAGVIESALQADRLPVVLGGDCSIVLGPLLALRRQGRYGLVYLDGHADFQHPADEPHGEVASLDLALATGRGPRPLTDLDGLAPLVRAEDVVLAGYRVFDDNDRFGTEHVRDSGITVLDYRDLRAGTIPLILDRALATVELQLTSLEWRADLRHVAAAYRALAHRHPRCHRKPQFAALSARRRYCDHQFRCARRIQDSDT